MKIEIKLSQIKKFFAKKGFKRGELILFLNSKLKKYNAKVIQINDNLDELSADDFLEFFGCRSNPLVYTCSMQEISFEEFDLSIIQDILQDELFDKILISSSESIYFELEDDLKRQDSFKIFSNILGYCIFDHRSYIYNSIEDDITDMLKSVGFKKVNEYYGNSGKQVIVLMKTK